MTLGYTPPMAGRLSSAQLLNGLSRNISIYSGYSGLPGTSAASSTWCGDRKAHRPSNGGDKPVISMGGILASGSANHSRPVPSECRGSSRKSRGVPRLHPECICAATICPSFAAVKEFRNEDRIVDSLLLWRHPHDFRARCAHYIIRRSNV